MKHKKKMNTNHIGHNIQYKHDLGQHFLYDMDLLRSLVKKTGITNQDCVLEIGAGAGTLTRALCEQALKVTSVEVDDALIPHLIMVQNEMSNLTIIRNDIRKVDLYSLDLGEEFYVIANLPYSITTQILDLFLGNNIPVKQISVMVQKEVADKIIAKPSDPAYGLLSVKCNYYCDTEMLQFVPAEAFTPPPKVDSAFVKLEFRKDTRLDKKNETLLWQLVKASYRLRRKTMMNALKTASPISAEMLGEILETMDLPRNVRGEVLSVEQWIYLTKEIRKRT